MTVPGEAFARLAQRVAALEAQRVDYLQADVTAVDTVGGTFTASVAGQADGADVPVAGIPAPEHFMPSVGDTVTLARPGAQLVYQPGRIADGAVGLAQLDETVTLSLGGNSYTYSPDAPSGSGAKVGDGWFQLSGSTVVGQWRWDGTAWQPVELGYQVIASVVAGAIATGTLAAGTTISVGDPTGTHVAIDGTNGLVAYVADPVDGVPNEATKFGESSGGYDDTGTPTWLINRAGVASVQALTVTGDPVFTGVPLSQTLELKARGGVAWCENWAPPAATATEIGMVMLTFTAETNHLYEIAADGLIPQPSADNGFALFRARYTDDGSTPTVASTVMAGANARAWSAASAWLNDTAHLEGHYWQGTGAPKTVSVLLTVSNQSGSGSMTIANDLANFPRHFRLKDLAFAPPPNGVETAGGGGSSAPAPVQQQELLVASSWTQSFDGSGRYMNWTGEAYQGYYSANGNAQSLIGFPDMTATLAGRTLTYAKIWLYFNHWYLNSGGTAVIGYHWNTSAPGSFVNTEVNQFQVPNWPKPAGGWVDLPTSWLGGIQTGAVRGIVLGPGPTTDSVYYGHADGAGMGSPPQFAVGYY